MLINHPEAVFRDPNVLKNAIISTTSFFKGSNDYKVFFMSFSTNCDITVTDVRGGIIVKPGMVVFPVLWKSNPVCHMSRSDKIRRHSVVIYIRGVGL